MAMNGHSSLTNGHTKPIKRAQNPPIDSFRPNPALYTNEHHGLEFRESPPLEPKETDCIVHVRANGICGSDMHFWHAGCIGDLNVTSPYVLGHEGAGTVLWVGSAVRTLHIGDAVAIEPGIPCHEPSCHPCTTGQYNLCPVVAFSGAPPHHGSIRRYHVHDHRYLHKFTERRTQEEDASIQSRGLTYAEGALLEPLSVVLHGVERAPIRLGEPVLICGAGPIGLIALAAAKASGAYPLVICDVDERRLEFAMTFIDACIPYCVEPGQSAEATGRAMQALFAEHAAPPPRVTFECTGVASSVQNAVWATQRGGEVMIIGVGKAVMDGLPFMEASMAEIDLKFINRYHHSWPYAIRLLESRYIDLNPLVTHTFRLDEAVKAMETVSNRTSGAIKVHILDGEQPTKDGASNGSCIVNGNGLANGH